jgi:hypothetical protein
MGINDIIEYIGQGDWTSSADGGFVIVYQPGTTDPSGKILTQSRGYAFPASGLGGGGNSEYVRDTPMQIEVGGAAIGQTFTGTVQDALDVLFYPFVNPQFIYTISPSLAEKGTTVSTVTSSGTITANGKVISERQLVRNGVQVTTFGSDNILYPESVSLVFSDSSAERTSTMSYEYTDSEGNQVVVSLSRTVEFAAPAYYGVGAVGLNEAGIKGLTKVVKTSKGLTANFSPTNQVYYYAWPQSQGTISSIKDPNNFQVIAGFTLRTATFTLADAVTTEAMYILEGNNLTSQTNFTLSFS